MSSSAIMLRELRIEARKPANFRLRSILAAIGTLAMGLMMADRAGGGSGIEFFSLFHQLMLGLILLICPVLTADTLSRERREGTLPLLLLTPLRPREIISTKFAVQALRALGFWLALVPIGTVPLLAGGVPPSAILTALALQSAALLIALTAGILVSAFARRFLAGALWSLVLTLSFWIANCLAFALAYLWLAGHPYRGGRILGEVLKLCTDPAQWDRRMLAQFQWKLALALNGLALIVAAFALFRLLGLKLAREQNGEIETARQTWFRRTFLTPRFWKHGFRKSMQRRMARNPLIWLEYRRAWSRAFRWAIVAALVVYESLVIAVALEGMLSAQAFALVALLLIMAFSAAASFQNERETGALELLLVAPFDDARLLLGRLRAVWSYYRPALLLIIATMALLAGLLAEILPRARGYPVLGKQPAELGICSLFLSFITVPVAGLYFSLRFRAFLLILALTILFGLVIPNWLGSLLLFVSSFFDDSFTLSRWTAELLSATGEWLNTRWEFVFVTHALLNGFFLLESVSLLRRRAFAL